MTSNNKRTYVNLPPDLARLLERLKAETGIPYATVIERALRLYCEANPRLFGEYLGDGVWAPVKEIEL